MRVAGLSKFSQICFDTTFWEHPQFLNPGRIQVFRLPEELASRVEITFSQLLDEYRDKSFGYEQMIRLKMEELALLLKRTLPRICSPELNGGTSSIDEVVGYIQSHYTDELSLSFLARLCGLTPSYFFRRSEKGPFVKEEEFDRKVGLLSRQMVEKYGIQYDPQQVIPADDDLADRVYQAGLELFLELGIYCRDTSRLMKFSRDEVQGALKHAPTTVTYGQGLDVRVVTHRTIEE